MIHGFFGMTVFSQAAAEGAADMVKLLRELLAA
jgi:hypothetical protein